MPLPPPPALPPSIWPLHLYQSLPLLSQTASCLSLALLQPPSPSCRFLDILQEHRLVGKRLADVIRTNGVFHTQQKKTWPLREGVKISSAREEMLLLTWKQQSPRVWGCLCPRPQQPELDAHRLGLEPCTERSRCQRRRHYQKRYFERTISLNAFSSDSRCLIRAWGWWSAIRRRQQWRSKAANKRFS